MKKIGLTGNIGSGKTTISNVFRTLGIPVFYADDEAKRLMVEDENLKKELTRIFGANVYCDNGINRKHLSELAFNDASILQKLNSIVHPFVQNYFIELCDLQSSQYIIKEAAILFESGTQKDLEAVICVKCPKSKRVERILKRDSISVEQIESRMRNQWDEEKKSSLSDYIIENDDEHLVIPQVLSIHNDLLK